MTSLPKHRSLKSLLPEEEVSFSLIVVTDIPDMGKFLYHGGKAYNFVSDPITYFSCYMCIMNKLFWWVTSMLLFPAAVFFLVMRLEKEQSQCTSWVLHVGFFAFMWRSFIFFKVRRKEAWNIERSSRHQKSVLFIVPNWNYANKYLLQC